MFKIILTKWWVVRNHLVDACSQLDLQLVAMTMISIQQADESIEEFT